MSRKSTDQEWERLAQDLCFRDERHMYESMYLEEGLSVSEIADRIKCGTATLNRRMSAFKIPKRARGGARKNADKKLFLWYMDQRVILAMKNKTLSELFDISYSMVYNYKRWKAAGSFVGYNLSTSGREAGMEGIRK